MAVSVYSRGGACPRPASTAQSADLPLWQRALLGGPDCCRPAWQISKSKLSQYYKPGRGVPDERICNGTDDVPHTHLAKRCDCGTSHSTGNRSSCYADPAV